MKNGICPKCGTTSIFTKPEGLKFAGMQRVVFIDTGGPTMASPAVAYVCTNCGYFENYIIDARKLAQVVEKWQKVPPAPQ